MVPLDTAEREDEHCWNRLASTFKSVASNYEFKCIGARYKQHNQKFGLKCLNCPLMEAINSLSVLTVLDRKQYMWKDKFLIGSSKHFISCFDALSVVSSQ